MGIQHSYKTFLEILQSVNSKPKGLKTGLEDMRLTLHEKKILQCIVNLRSNKFDQLDGLLSDDSYEQYPLLNGFRFYILGFVYLCRADSKRSEEYFLKAIPMLQSCPNPYFVYRAYSGLFYTAVNLKNSRRMDQYRHEVLCYSPRNAEDVIAIKLIDLCYYLLSHQLEKAESLLEELSPLKKEMTEIQVMNYLIEKFDFFMKVERLDMGMKVLEEMKEHRTFRLSANYKFMTVLLKFLLLDEPIYVYDKDFAGHEDLFLMINVIKKLDESQAQEATIYWEELKSVSPDVYEVDFRYNGDKCLFSLCLKKTLEFTPPQREEVPFKKEDYSPQETLLLTELLRENGTAKKEKIYARVYGKDPVDKQDFIKLYALVYRINRRGEFFIKTKKGGYVLERVIKEIA